MADNTTAPDPLAPAAAPAVDTTPPMSFSEALSRKAEFFNDPGWIARYNRGDIEARAELDRVDRSLAWATRPPEPSSPNNVDELVDWAGTIAGDLSPEVIQYHLRERGPVSPHEVKLAQQRKAARMNDPIFRDAYFDGESGPRQEMLLLNIILSSPVRDQT